MCIYQDHILLFSIKKSYLEHNSLIVPPAESFHTQHLAPKIKL